MNGPIYYNSPLGISKREWIRVVGINLAILLAVYIAAIIVTVNGGDLFLLRFYSDSIQRMEDMLRGWGVYALVQIAFASIEETLICAYVIRRKPSVIVFAAHFLLCVGVDLIFMLTTGVCPPYMAFALGVLTCITVSVIEIIRDRRHRFLAILARMGIAVTATILLNEGIGLFRTLTVGLWKEDYSSSVFLALSIEYDIALGLVLGFLTLIIPWEKGGMQQCQTSQDAGGSSQTTTSSSPKSLPKKPNLSPRMRRRLLLLKIRVIVIQTMALIVTAGLPVIAGRPVEFSLCYISFCATRLALGFRRSIHFRSEITCITIGALCFWAITFLAPSAEASIVISLVYGGGMALLFRLYWELHDLIMYRRASKTDRYAMLYCSLKGNADPMHIKGVMLSRGFSRDDVDLVQRYMSHEKIEAIASDLGYAKVTIEKQLTEIAERMYQSR